MAITRVAHTLPNFYIWWNRRLKDAIGPAHGYPRFATHAYAALFDAGAVVTKSARAGAPKARHIAVITNAAEPRLDNRFTHRLVAEWRRHGAEVETFEFPASEGLPHDLIDPISNQPAVIERVYPVVSAFIEGTPHPLSA